MHGSLIKTNELASFELFKELSTAEVEIVSKYIHCRNYPKKTQLISEGDPSHCIYFILSGQVKVFLDDDKGKEIVVNQHSVGEFFGELGLIQQIPRTASVMTTENSRLGIMADSDFRVCMRNHPAIAMNLIQNVVTRLVEATETIRKLGLMDVYGRIAVTFLNLSEEVDGKRVVKEKLTQQTIASHVGASREMVARILKDLKSGNYISVEKGIITILKPLPHEW